MPSAVTVPAVVCWRRARAPASVRVAGESFARVFGTPCISFVVQMPWKSGSPQGVLGALYPPCPETEVGASDMASIMRTVDPPAATRVLRMDPPECRPTSRRQGSFIAASIYPKIARAQRSSRPDAYEPFMKSSVVFRAMLTLTCKGVRSRARAFLTSFEGVMYSPVPLRQPH